MSIPSNPTPSPLPWYRRLFQSKWGEEQFVQVVGYKYRYGGNGWTDSKGSLYFQLNRHTNQKRYWLRCNHGDMPLDGNAWEQNQTLIFL